MPSTSKAQQRLMGMAYSLKKGDMDPNDASQEVKDLADSMTLKQLKDFAETKHEGLPDKVEEKIKVNTTLNWVGKDWDTSKKKNVDVVKKVLITRIEGGKVYGKFEGESNEFIIRDPEKTLKTIKEGITPANIGGMGPTLLPTATQPGSGDVLSGSGDAEEEYLKMKKERKDYLMKMKKFKTFEQFVNENINITESALNLPNGMEQFQKDEKSEGKQADIYLAKFTGKSFKAQSTDKTWDDGVPVTKNFTRGGYKEVKISGEHYIIEGDTFWYFRVGRTWYAVKRADYGTPPFEY